MGQSLSDVAVARPADAPRPVGAQAVAFSRKAALAELLLSCDVVADRGRRDSLVKDMRRVIRFNIPRNATDRTDVMNLIRTCLDYPKGLEELIYMVGAYEGDSHAMQAINAWMQVNLPSP